MGEATARVLAMHFGDLESIEAATEEKLEEVPAIGPVVAAHIAAFFRQKHNRELIEKCRHAGVHWPKVERPPKADQPLAGKIFVLTGTLISLTREEAKAKLEALGATIAGSVSKNTDYVVAGEKAGSKLHKAEQLGIVILDEKQLLALLKKIIRLIAIRMLLMEPLLVWCMKNNRCLGIPYQIQLAEHVARR